MKQETFELIDKAVNGDSNLEKLPETETLGFVQAMEEMDELSLIFANLPKYRLPGDTKAFLERLISSNNMEIIKAEV